MHRGSNGNDNGFEFTFGVEDQVAKMQRLRTAAKRAKKEEELVAEESARDRLQNLQRLVQSFGRSEAFGRVGGGSMGSAKTSGKRPRDLEADDCFDEDGTEATFKTSRTLRQAVGLNLNPAPFSESALIIIDAQNTYTQGPLKLYKVEQALVKIKELLERARAAEIPIFHVQHDAGVDTLYDVKGTSGAIVPALRPKDDEEVIVKNYPNAFAETSLHDFLQTLRCRNLIIVGFMTHCCVNSTARAAFNYGCYDSITVVADCTATRDLPDPTSSGSVPAIMQQRAALASMNDLHCNVVASSDLIED